MAYFFWATLYVEVFFCIMPLMRFHSTSLTAVTEFWAKLGAEIKQLKSEAGSMQSVGAICYNLQPTYAS